MARRHARLVGVLAALIVTTALTAGCGGGHDPLSGPDATPKPRTAPTVSVDPCRLVTTQTASTLLERTLVVVGRTAGAARNTTLGCDIGERFGEPVVSVSLAPDAIAKDVFEAAYGDRAGGNPDHTELGEESYVRTEGTSRVMHVFLRGAVISVRVPYGPPGNDDSVTMVQLKRLTRAAVESLPENPVVKPRTAPDACNEIDAAVLSDTLGRQPALATGLLFSGGSLICSWSGQPGSVTLMMTDDAAEVTRYLDAHPLSQDLEVGGVLPAAEGQAFSSPSTAGDLVVVVDDRDALMTSVVVPAAGYADDGIDTSDSERAVARAGLALLDHLH